MTESYKIKSKLATAIAFIASFIAYIGKDGLNQIMPAEYANIIPIIVFIAGWILAQTTENKRVERAEKLIEEKYETDPTIPNETIVGDDNAC